jgi:hypothetical protein
VPDQEEPLDVFTCHLSPSMREALMKDWPEALLAMGDRTRAGQFAEMKSFVERQRSSSTSMCVVGGDFNANIKHLEGGGVEEGIAYPAVKKAMVDGLGFEDAGWRVTCVRERTRERASESFRRCLGFLQPRFARAAA